MSDAICQAHDRVQIVIASTARTGTTWLQLLLSDLYAAAPLGVRDWDIETGAFRPADTGGFLGSMLAGSNELSYSTWTQFWVSLPDRAIINAHWHAHPEIVEELKSRGVPVVTIARHPLDVLISHLAWANRYENVGLGLDRLRGEGPTSGTFLHWATDDLTQWLLSITTGWWYRLEAHRLRYEDLVADTRTTLAALAAEFNLPTTLDVGEAVARSDQEGLRQTKISFWARLLPRRRRTRLLGLWADVLRRGARDAFVERHRERRHFWQGQPGLWRSLIPGDSALRIAESHGPLFDALGYDCDPDPTLTSEQAEANWERLLEDAA